MIRANGAPSARQSEQLSTEDALEQALSRMRILLVDDQRAALVIFESILRRSGYTEVFSCDEPLAAVEEFDRIQPDMLVIDYHMPGKSGLDILRELGPRLPDAFPVIMVTSDVRREVRLEALDSGARDFINKPVDSSEVKLRVRNLLENRWIRKQLESDNDRLEEAIRQRSRELEGAHLEILVRLAHAAEYRHAETGRHTWRVAHACGAIGRRLGLDDERIEMLFRAARLHDVGKIGIPDRLLLKSAELTPDEYAIVQGHTVTGAKLLSGSTSPVIRLAEQLALFHHERWDGKGYPMGLTGEKIPLGARILAVADTYDALTNDRDYRTAVSKEAAATEIARQSGSQFDPRVVAAFCAALQAGELDAPPPS